MKYCSLCKQEFDENDPLFEARKAIHERFHQYTIVKRNTQIGVVEWL